MKNFLIPMLIVCTIVIFAGCGHKEENQAPQNVNQPVVEEVQKTMEKNDNNIVVQEHIIEEEAQPTEKSAQ